MSSYSAETRPTAGDFFRPHVDADARILLFSPRNTTVHLWEVGQLEFEDVICEVDSVHMLAPRYNWHNDVDVLRSRGANWLRKAVGLPKTWPSWAWWKARWHWSAPSSGRPAFNARRERFRWE